MPIVRVGDLDLHYHEQGSGPALVLVHGLGGSATDWDHQIAEFARRYRVIVPELRGFGGTLRGRGLPSIPRFAADLCGLLDALGIETCDLVGHSMGGAVSMEFALTHPQRVRRLVIANSVPSFRPRRARHYFELSYRWIVMGLLGPARLARIGAWRMFPEADQAAERARSIERGARNTRAAYLGALAALSRWSVIPRLRELKMPVLVMASEHDYFGHEETVRFAHALPRARLQVVDDAHHALPSERPAEFNAALWRFLDAPAVRRRQATRTAAQELDGAHAG